MTQIFDVIPAKAGRCCMARIFDVIPVKTGIQPYLCHAELVSASNYPNILK
ncbi:hypothetical protein [Rickettsia endosymbiont of Orchestes rusci]|uniref:hypothetical protein n=1 Tax=Rickettsia endosymbiont of Orchestes rusci TaxID=3066250 RepID=UPI00313E1AF3